MGCLQDKPAQEYKVSISVKDIQKDVKTLEIRLAKSEYEEQVEIELLRRQLESAIRESRNAEEEYQELFEELQATTQIDTDTSFPNPASPSNSGVVRGKEEDRKEYGKKGYYTTPLGIPKGLRETS